MLSRNKLWVCNRICVAGWNFGIPADKNKEPSCLGTDRIKLYRNDGASPPKSFMIAYKKKKLHLGFPLLLIQVTIATC